MDSLDAGEFQPRVVDKVERLFDLLEEMDRHPDLRGKLALHGGTAINLFMLEIPRLSVDIDVSYIGALGCRV
ncbi:nucleotidyl transferase AbiEii/AbiGii toxin family protein [Arabiibacter massiliensis]|uniref:nucleotidyl transferase AbiEii/AbiGii toxin family protein n=1 Tax=Arabiibacter massiliensis TaxID=1870985 RepID=UPI00155A67E4|nr:nucleotidyl transferase AbiEii/AbiGii toxin family protein [Arabiibacter massiliensis]